MRNDTKREREKRDVKTEVVGSGEREICITEDFHELVDSHATIDNQKWKDT